MTIDIAVGKLISPEKDIPALEKLADECFGSIYKKPDGKRIRDVIRPWLDDPAKGAVFAYSNGDIVGFCFYELNATSGYNDPGKYYREAIAKSGKSIVYSGNSVSVQFIAIADGYKNAGIGKMLSEAALIDLRSKGISQIWVTCWMKQGTSILHLARSFGMQEVYHFHKHYIDGSGGIILYLEI